MSPDEDDETVHDIEPQNRSRGKALTHLPVDPDEDDEIEPQSSRSIEQAPAPTNLWTPMKMMTLYLRLSGSARLKVDRMLVINLPGISSTPGLAQ